MEELDNWMGEKIQGYLEKKTKRKFWHWCRWKKYWFVLDGKILLFFKTKEDYQELGTCKGTIDMGLAQSVKPTCPSKVRRNYPLEVISRTNTLLLSASDQENQTRWVLALQNAMRLPEISIPVIRSSLRGMSQRSSMENSDEHLQSYLEEELEMDDDSTETLEMKSQGVQLCTQYSIPEDFIGTVEYGNAAVDNSELFHSSTLPAVLTYAQQMALEVEQLKAITKTKIAVSRSLSHDSKIQPKEKSTKHAEEEWYKPRSRSLYEEIVEEVLEITGRSIWNERIDCVARSAEEEDSDILQLCELNDSKQYSNVCEIDNPNAKTRRDIISSECCHVRSKSGKLCPPKPPRVPSVKVSGPIADTECVLGEPFDETPKIISDHGKMIAKKFCDKDAEADTYESATESCYLTAESSEYEGDNSSKSSTRCNSNDTLMPDQENLINDAVEARPQLLQVQSLTEPATDVHVSIEYTGSEMSLASIKPQTGSLCNLLDVTDDDVFQEGKPTCCNRTSTDSETHGNNLPANFDSSFPKTNRCLDIRPTELDVTARRRFSCNSKFICSQNNSQRKFSQ